MPTSPPPCRSHQQAPPTRASRRSGRRAALLVLTVTFVEVIVLLPASPGRATAPQTITALWARRYNGPGNGADYYSSAAVSSDGAMVYVTGRSEGSGSGTDYATIGYDGLTGARVWISRYNAPRNGDDTPGSIAVSPDGARVYVTGYSQGFATPLDYAT